MTKSEDSNGYVLYYMLAAVIVGFAFLFYMNSVKIVWTANLPIETNGAVAVNIQDQTSEVIDLHLSKLVQNITLVGNYSIDDNVITISSVAEPTDGNTVCLKEGTAFYQGEILSHVANGLNWDVTLDTPLDYPYTELGGCSERTIEMAVDGSVTPQIFTVSPKGLVNGTRWDIVRVMFSITDETSMDDGKFGGIAGGITNGIVFRKVDGVSKNIFNAKTNGDLAAHMYDLQYVADTLGPAGQYGLRGRRTFGGQSKNGVVVRLEADSKDEFQIIIQDDLTQLTSFQAIVQGHVVED